MVPDKFNMVDMGGIDLIMMQGEAVLGLYDKLMAAISNCQYQCLYNWLFDGVLIPPTYVQLTDNDGEVYLNEGVSVTSDDVIHIYSVEPSPPDPEIIPLLAEENGTYTVPSGKDGFNPVTVDVPSYTPVIEPISITENGTYTAPAGKDGYSPVTVNVPSSRVQPLKYLINSNYYVAVGKEYYYGTAIETVASFELEIGEHYILSVGSPAPDRFRRVLFDSEPFTQIPAVIPGPTEQVQLQQGTDVGGGVPTEDPPAYSTVAFQATKRYLGVHLSRYPDTEPAVYLFKL